MQPCRNTRTSTPPSTSPVSVSCSMVMNCKWLFSQLYSLRLPPISHCSAVSVNVFTKERCPNSPHPNRARVPFVRPGEDPSLPSFGYRTRTGPPQVHASQAPPFTTSCPNKNRFYPNFEVEKAGAESWREVKQQESLTVGVIVSIRRTVGPPPALRSVLLQLVRLLYTRLRSSIAPYSRKRSFGSFPKAHQPPSDCAMRIEDCSKRP
jgi:hypothetical protein